MSDHLPSTLLCLLEVGVDPTPDTSEALIGRGFNRHQGARGPHYLARFEALSFADLAEWLVALDWSAQVDIPRWPMLMFKTDLAADWTFYSVPNRARLPGHRRAEDET
jgi:hypothetical protein